MYKSPKLIINYPCGLKGLNSNRNVFRVAPDELTVAENIRFDNQAINKLFGLSPLGTAITGAPTSLGGIATFVTIGVEKSLTAWNNGKIYKSLDDEFGTVDLGTFGATSEPVVFVPLGNISESGTPEAHRVGIWSRNTTPKQLVADAGSLSNLTSESADWASSKPSFATYHDFRQIASGVDAYPHNLYISDFDDVMNFATGTAKVTSIYPGEGDRIVAGCTYLDTQMVILKAPYGIYLIDTLDLTGTDVPRYKITDRIGGAGPRALTKVGGDVYFASSQGRIHMLSQARPDIDPIFSDLTNSLNLTEFIKNNVDLTRIKHAILHFDDIRQELWYCFSRIGGDDINDSAIIIKFNDIEQRPPQVSIDTRGGYYNAMWKRLDATGKHEVLCAGKSGKVMQANSIAANVDGEPFSATFSHPASDFGYIDPMLRRKEKRFDYLELFYLPTGSSSELFVDVIIDGQYRKTLSTTLDSSGVSTYDYSEYDTATYAGTDYQRKLLEIDCVGTKLALKWYNNGDNETISIVDANIYADVETDTNESV